jgi:hypothetical protein
MVVVGEVFFVAGRDLNPRPSRYEPYEVLLRAVSRLIDDSQRGDESERLSTDDRRYSD